MAAFFLGTGLNMAGENSCADGLKDGPTFCGLNGEPVLCVRGEAMDGAGLCEDGVKDAGVGVDDEGGFGDGGLLSTGPEELDVLVNEADEGEGDRPALALFDDVLDWSCC